MAKDNETATQENNGGKGGGKAKKPTLYRLTRNFNGRQVGETFTATQAKKLGLNDKNAPLEKVTVER